MLVATYLQYFDGPTGFLKIAYSDKINAPPLHIGREMGTALYDVYFKTSKSPECEDLDVVGGNGKPHLGVDLARCKGEKTAK